ncbi:hypothetical protein Pyrfu_1225 [Pyrolobus fumarii 1A]|uniref:Uncharacterized protein n=1 Tax=Pyrolobus fumarii (strain DSM 11204 / 1A) TaxID=694429 RepID=G0EFY4_PYRF1|nr:hypothetical protein Pyrfu_1225 [Pyrolobus fumarii 1A]
MNVLLFIIDVDMDVVRASLGACRVIVVKGPRAVILPLISLREA